mgnify:CR=1 FL=1
MRRLQGLETGLLMMWKVPKGKVNPKTLGYVCPNGNINFQSEDVALNYAKNRVMKCKGYERGVVIKGNTIIADIKGSENCVNYKNIDITDTVIVHNHPNDTVISLDDAVCLLRGNAKKIVAFNTKGQYSQLTLLPKIRRLNFSWREWLINKLNGERETIAEKCLEDLGEQSIPQKISQIFYNADEKLTNIIQRWLRKRQENPIVDTSEFPVNIKPFFDHVNDVERKCIPLQSKYTHDLFSKSDKKFGFKYETNYSNI